MIMKRTTAALLLCVFLLTVPTNAFAITQSQILSRAKVWVRHKVKYSQTSTHQGYRRDCSGFVSMAWKLKKSYTTHNINRVAKRIAIRKLVPGDAVWTPGHITVFVRWIVKNKVYLSAEEYNWGKPASYRHKHITRRAKAYRHPRLVMDSAVRKVASDNEAIKVTEVQALQAQQDQIKLNIEVYGLKVTAEKIEDNKKNEIMDVFGINDAAETHSSIQSADATTTNGWISHTSTLANIIQK